MISNLFNAHELTSSLCEHSVFFFIHTIDIDDGYDNDRRRKQKRLLSTNEFRTEFFQIAFVILLLFCHLINKYAPYVIYKRGEQTRDLQQQNIIQ